MERNLFKAMLIAAFAVCVSACGTSTNQTNQSQSQLDDGDEDSLRPIPEGVVDLGLSVKWATCNLGATKPEEFGDYYAWGETETKEEYTTENAKWYWWGFDDLKAKGVINEKGNLTADYDVATKLLGEGFRMPTIEEQTELFEKCTWKRTQLNDVIGYEFVGPNGNSIFLPKAGYQDSQDTLSQLFGRLLGWYLSSTIVDDRSIKIPSLRLNTYGWWYAGENDDSQRDEHITFKCQRMITPRYIGVSVRPVWK